MIKKIKQFFHKRKLKEARYWRKLDVDRELKIEQIKNSRSKRSFIDNLGIILILIYFFVLYPLGMVFLYKAISLRDNNTAIAEDINIVNTSYQDILDDSNAIVNFNQILQFSVDSLTWKGLTISHNGYNVNVVGTSTFTSGDSNVYGFLSNFDVVQGKQYYFSSSSDYWQIFTYGQGSSSTSLNKSIFTASSTGSANLTLRPFVQSHIANGSVLNDSFYLYIICLSDMFGLGNEPDVDECIDLFIADTYPYNAGSPISLSGLDAYSQGYNDATKSSVIITNSINPATQLFASNTSYWVPQNNNGAVNYTGRAGIYLGYTAQAGNVMTISYTGWIHTNSYLQVLYESNGQYIPLVQDLKQYDVGDYSIYNIFETSFTLPVATQYLYFNTNDPQDDGRWGSTLVQLSITTTAYDFQTAIADARKYGYTQAENIYKGQLHQYTDPTGTGYTSIYQQGYTAGMNSTSEEFALQYYTFPQFIGALFDVPVRVLNSLLDFDVLGYNMKNLIFSILTISIILSIVRFILQKSGGE